MTVKPSRLAFDATSGPVGAQCVRPDDAKTTAAQNSAEVPFIVQADRSVPQTLKRQWNQLILSVDDDPTLLLGREQLLKSEGFLTVSATDGQQALALFATCRGTSCSWISKCRGSTAEL
jgi:hypothetical protein